MVLAAVVLGGRWGVLGAVLGALAIAAYDRLLVEAITGGLRTLGAAINNPALQAADLRQHSYAIFGIALWLATLFRARGTSELRHQTCREAHLWGHSNAQAVPPSDF
jgi:ABC-type branched-subunit amino acid transport system permease subunit